MSPQQPAPLGVDRATIRRRDEAWLAEAWRRARILLVHDGQTIVHQAATSIPSQPGTAVNRDDSGEWALMYSSADTAPAGAQLFLGLADDVPYFAVIATQLPTPSADQRSGGLRELMAVLPADEAACLTQAIALENWHRRHPMCATCGAATEVAEAGHLRRCPRCGAEHFPRTDPAVIMLVHDGVDRCLLGRHGVWPKRRFSTLAGFVEPGESLEETVAREVAEEVGVSVTGVEYFGNQPWPFPASLMLGFLATARYAAPIVDGDEISEARWFTRAELIAAVASGEVFPPSSISIARRLVEAWLGESLTRAPAQ